jgi:hypothetical protein
MVDGNPPILWGFLAKIWRAHFHGKHVDLMWYGRSGIRRKIKGDCTSKSFFYIRDYDLRLDVVRKVFLGKKFVCDIGEKGGEYGSKMYSYHCNGKWLMDFHVYLVMFLFSLKYERKCKDSSSY